MGIDLITSGFKKNFHLENENGQLSVVRDRKGCCFRGRIQALQREQEGVAAAIKLFKATPTSAETALLYSAVNQRYREIRALTSGFIGWIKSLFRSCRHNRQLKQLQSVYLDFRQAFSQKELIESIADKVLAPENPQMEAELFKQLQEQVPSLFKKGKIGKKDFNNAPFFIQKEVSEYQVIFPSKTLKLTSLSDLKWLVLSNLTLVDLDSKLKQLSEKYGIHASHNAYGGLLVKLNNLNPLSSEVLSKLEEKFPIAIDLTLDSACSASALKNFYKVHGQKITQLSLEDVEINANRENSLDTRFPSINEKNSLDACLSDWFPPIPSALHTITIKHKELKSFDIECYFVKKFENLATLNFHCKKLTKVKLRSLNNFQKLYISRPQTITDLSIFGCLNLSTTDFSQYSQLETLELRKCNITKIQLGNIKKIKDLLLEENPIEELPDLTQLSNLKALFLNNCTELQKISLSNLTAKFALYLLNCTNLRELSLDNCEVVPCPFFFTHHMMGYENHYQSLEKLTLRNMPYTHPPFPSIDCSWLENLKEIYISNMRLEEAKFSGLNLMHLYLRDTHLRSLDLSHCQFSEKCLEVIAEQVQQWEHVNCINLRNCQLTNEDFETLSTRLSALPMLTTLDISGNAITRIPEAFNRHPFCLPIKIYFTQVNDYQIIPHSGGTHTIFFTRDDLKDSFLPLIINFSSGLTLHTSDLHTIYAGERGQDGGGLSRDFIGELFTVIANKCLLNGILSLEKSLQTFVTEENAEMLFRAIGKILAFVLRTTGRYPIGNIFSIELFESLKNCSSSVIDKSYDELSVEELLSLSSHAFTDSFDLSKIAAFLSTKSQEETSEFTEVLNSFYTKLHKPVPDFSDFEGLKTRTRRLLFKHCKSRLWPIHAILKGFSTFAPIWQVRTKIKPEFMEQVIQGVSNKEHVLKSLDYSMQFPPEQREWLEEWIKKASKPRLRCFIQFLAGAKALSQGQRILIQATSSLSLGAHACGFQLDLPIESSKDSLWAALDDLANGTQTFNLF